MSFWAIAIAIVLLAANAFFVAVEFAILAARRSRIEPLAEEGNRRARYALAAMGDLNRQLAGAQLGITMASLGLGFIAEPALAHSLGISHVWATVIALAVIASIHMVIGEMVPKNVVIASPERSALWLAGPQLAFVTLLSPVIWFLNALTNLAVRLFGIEPSDELETAHTAAELATMVEASRGEGLIDEFDYSLLSSALDLAARPVRTVMVARGDVVAAPLACTAERLSGVVVDSGHSRIPVYGSGLDDIEGFVHAKDLVHLPEEAAGERVPAELVRPMLRATGEQTLESILLAMRSARIHLAVVADRRGRTIGVVTLEDVLEELVGDIVDESDRLGVTATEL